MTTGHHTSGAAVIRAGTADVAALSQVIAEAFHGLAPSRWLIGDADARRGLFPGYFQILTEHALAQGTAYTTPGRTAAALWIHAGQHGPPAAEGYGARLAAAVGGWAPQFHAFDQVLDEHHPLGTVHHHLMVLAVRPGCQGQGTGTVLLGTHHAILDQRGIPAYLEASSPATRRFYLARGYADHGPPIGLPGGPDMYPMWRNPRPPGARM
jgi:GNAT superfamily N-acetyltransferase